MDNGKNMAVGKEGKPKKPEKLTDLQTMFVREYVVDYIAGRAYQRAQKALGKKVSNDWTADQEGSRTLRLAKVRAAADKMRDEKQVPFQDMQKKLIEELLRTAYAEPGKIVAWVKSGCGSCWEPGDPRLMSNPDAINKDCAYCKGRGVGHVRITPTAELKDGEARLYDGIEETGRGGIKVHMRSRDKAIELLAKHFGIGPERVELTGKDGGPIEITGARDRLLASITKRTLRS